MAKVPTVSIQGRYLVKQNDGSRFLLKGMAFPAPLKSKDYNETAWINVLKQVKVELKADINTIRLYRMDPTIDYSGFFHYAASLNIYVMVPLTSVGGNGSLDRTKEAPHCYSRQLLEYGVACLQNYMQYPNTLAGVVGNEVMDSIESWKAAPCIKAYVRDLKRFMTHHMNRSLPLMYTAQDNGIGAAVTAPHAMRLTANYLSCITTNGKREKDAMIDVFGINVESWCSSTGTFRQNDDGSVGTYYELYKALHNVSVALVFAEMGCAQSLFNRDNNIADKTRDWKQIPVVLQEMKDTWSGFSAYTYDGNPDFDMMRGGPWNGRDVLEPTQDFVNFRNQLAALNETSNYTTSNSTITVVQEETPPSPHCEDVLKEMHDCCHGVFVDHDIDELYNVDRIPSYAHHEFFSYAKQSSDDDDEFTVSHSQWSNNNSGGLVLMVVVVLLSVSALLISRSRRRMQHDRELYRRQEQEEQVALNVKYQSIN